MTNAKTTTMPKKLKKEKTAKQKISKDDYEKKVIELAKQGLTCEKIGEKLRQEGIHPSEHGVKLSKILKEKKLYVNPDIKNIEAKLKRVESHSLKNKQDKRAKREKERIFSQFRKLKIYHQE